jgi:carbamoyl-phosphate synthase large subunit
VIPTRKLVTHHGEVEQVEVCEDPKLIEIGVRLGELLGHIGSLEVDLIMQEDSPYLLGLNLGFGDSYPAAHFAGANFPRLILQMGRGEPVQPEIGKFKGGIKTMKTDGQPEYRYSAKPVYGLWRDLLTA